MLVIAAKLWACDQLPREVQEDIKQEGISEQLSHQAKRKAEIC